MLLILDNAQHDLLMDSPVHYNVSVRCNSKTYKWECDCDSATAKLVKEVIKPKVEDAK